MPRQSKGDIIKSLQEDLAENIEKQTENSVNFAQMISEKQNEINKLKKELENQKIFWDKFVHNKWAWIPFLIALVMIVAMFTKSSMSVTNEAGDSIKVNQSQETTSTNPKDN